MLNPLYTQVSIGIAVGDAAFDTPDGIVYRSPHAVVQQFATNNVAFDRLPAISDGRLTASGTVLLDRESNDESTHLLATVYHHPPTHALTQRQLASSATYSHDRPVATIEFSSPEDAEALPPITYPSAYSVYPDPYLADPGPPLTSDAEQSKLHQQARDQATNPQRKETTIYQIRDAVERIDGADFSVTANIAPVLAEYGSGVYTIRLAAGNQTVFRAAIAEYSIVQDGK